MKVTYDPGLMMMYVSKTGKPKKVSNAKVLAPGVIADLGEKGQVLGLQIWGGPLELEVLS